MNRNFILFYLLIYVTGIAAQPKMPVGFVNFTPKWEHYSYMPELTDSLQVYANQQKPIIDNNNIFLLHNILDNTTQGYTLENLNLDNGTTIWRDYYISYQLNQCKFAHSIKKENDKINLLAFKETDSKYASTFWIKSHINKIQYDKNTGIKSDSIITDPNDPKNKLVSSSFFTILVAGGVHLYEYNNHFYYLDYSSGINSVTQQTDALFRILKLDAKGYVKDSIYHLLPFKQRPKQIAFAEYQPQKYMAFIFASDDKNTDKTIQLVFFDAEFKIEKTIDITDKFAKNLDAYTMRSYDENNFIVENYEKVGDKNLLRCHIFNYNGEEIEEISFKDHELSATTDYLRVTLLKPSNRLMAVANRRVNNKSTLEFFTSDGLGKLIKLKTINMTQQLASTGAFSMPNNHILCNFSYRDSANTKYKRIPRFSYWIMFSPESLNFSLSANTPSSILGAVKFYPNPTNTQLTIQTELDYDAVSVYSIEGKLIQQLERQDNTLDVSTLPTGMYLFELLEKNKAVTRKEKFVKLE